MTRGMVMELKSVLMVINTYENRKRKKIKLEMGLVRLSQLAFRKGIDVKVIPV